MEPITMLHRCYSDDTVKDSLRRTTNDDKSSIYEVQTNSSLGIAEDIPGEIGMAQTSLIYTPRVFEKFDDNNRNAVKKTTAEALIIPNISKRS
jgi:hypothetical protein